MSVDDERGFTLIELLIALLLGGIIMAAALSMLTRSQLAEKDVEDRVEANQRGRLAMDAVIRPLRSMVCLSDGTRPIIAAAGDSITFYADLDGDQVYDPEQWRISAVTNASGVMTGIKLDRWPGLTPPVASTVAPTSTRTLITNISPLLTASNVAIPLFSYGMFNAAADQTTTPMPAGTISTASTDVVNTSRIAQVDVSFNANPTAVRAASARRVSTAEQSSYYARTVARDTTYPSFSCNT